MSDGQLPDLKNPDVNTTSSGMSVAFWIVLVVLTFVILVAGYGIGVWHFPVTPIATPVPLPS